ncbi:hypothetical protein [Roseisolibacter agri]|uniref:Uncharacterized protein n=1 Tax=Roseisolibacter agri TaxID=2014610 RepID=A0AA37QDP3_9BACT|nr:hypothetical protein [Roseisolibacter agri]GLC26991.1 hypothetical protein rosag_35040 [Roseisolibacter agri]
MTMHNLDLGIPLTREQWEQLGHGADARPDFGVLRWAPAEFDVIRVAVREDELPEGWRPAAPRADARVSDREVARFRWNDGRPYAEVDPPSAPEPPAITAAERATLDARLDHWVRERWHILLRESGIAYDRGALPPEEPYPATGRPGAAATTRSARGSTGGRMGEHETDRTRGGDAARRESGQPGGGQGRRDEIGGRTGVWPRGAEGVPPDAEVRMEGALGGGDYDEAGGSELVYRDGQLLGGLTAGPDGEPTIDIHGGDRPDADRRPPRGPDERDAGMR